MYKNVDRIESIEIENKTHNFPDRVITRFSDFQMDSEESG